VDTAPRSPERRMTRRHYYAFVLFALMGMVAGLLELGYQLVTGQEVHGLT
jgi:hypothetical protein